MPSPDEHMINVKEAVAAADDFARSLYEDTDLPHLRLEEVELSGDERSWMVTLGWVEPSAATRAPLLVPSAIEKLPRVYKTFTVDVESGEVRSMKIRDVG